MPGPKLGEAPAANNHEKKKKPLSERIIRNRDKLLDLAKGLDSKPEVEEIAAEKLGEIWDKALPALRDALEFIKDEDPRTPNQRILESIDFDIIISDAGKEVGVDVVPAEARKELAKKLKKAVELIKAKQRASDRFGVIDEKKDPDGFAIAKTMMETSIDKLDALRPSKPE